MAQTKDEIIQAFEEHLSKSGKKYYSEFYVGITNDIDRRLFHEHNVQREGMWWVYSIAPTKEDAEYVENYYQSKGMRGNHGGGTDDSKIVYCYAVTPTTVDC